MQWAGGVKWLVGEGEGEGGYYLAYLLELGTGMSSESATAP